MKRTDMRRAYLAQVKIDKFDRKACAKVDSMIQNAMAEAIQHMGLSVEIEGGSFRDGEYLPKIVITTNGTNRHKDNFELHCWRYNLTKTDYNREFTHRGIQYRLAEISTRSPKYPFVGVRVSDSKRFKFDRGIIEKAMKEDGE